MSGLICDLHTQSPVATASMSLKYNAPVKRDRLYVLEAAIRKREGRVVEINTQIRDLENSELKIDSNLVFKTVNWGLEGRKTHPFVQAFYGYHKSP